jgi:2',3'-cyclic-nucleotide 2'-phosphodiesterase/3'-nucleotidase
MPDLHGNFVTYDHIRKRAAIGGLPYVYSYVKQEREDTTQQVILLNAGDILQGQMAAYFYNYIDKRETFVPALLFNKIGVDASVMGNHDLEPGSPVYGRFNRISRELNSEILGANVFFKGTSIRYLKPYVILHRAGLRIAVLGLTTPIHTKCVITEISDGIDVRNMLEPAQYWMNRIQNEESPDLVIGLFHVGFIDKTGIDTAVLDCYNANDPMYIARNVPGFDGIILGHRHKILTDSIHVDNRPVWLVEGGYGGASLAVLDFEIQKTPGKKAKILNSSVKVQNVSDSIKLTQDILDELEIEKEEKLIAAAANEFVAVLKDTIFNMEAFLGSSFFVDLVHRAKLEYMGVEVSFASPLSSNVVVPSGNITFSDLLSIYRYENRLIFFKMSGREIKDYLEYSYSLWINQMHSPNDRLFRTVPIPNDTLGRRGFEIPQYNFDSGAGLDYEVDVTKPTGQRITILRMWSNRPFHEDSTYSVVSNAYRFFGAGGHMELGAKIKAGEPRNATIIRADHSQVRELIRQDFIRQKEVKAFRYNNWKFVPDHYVIPAINREFKELR